MNPTNYVLLIHSRGSYGLPNHLQLPWVKLNWRFSFCCRCPFHFYSLSAQWLSTLFCHCVWSSVPAAKHVKPATRITNILFIFMLLFSVIAVVVVGGVAAIFSPFFGLYHNHKSVLNKMISSLTNWLVLQHINHTRMKVLYEKKTDRHRVSGSVGCREEKRISRKSRAV